ncbi:heavy metal response regulator transcription factor [Aquariibacter albus]|uniref:Heavy metal response regulator transcription factor n=1 Tax=Aquariibacter albus TaxID=2759899 RepID=A0A839HGT6_9BURK|nr:heavy metal response regulator transcription factor [Aquariibacter albus]MBB1161557.1 heavy metal response regulator transcription factor [Aquariibacter albus]
MRLLIIEDEPRLAAYLHKGLREHGHVVDVARDGIDGRHLALEGDYDLVLLDVMLPGLDGFAVLKDLRARKNTPVLMLTARDQVEDRVRGLRAGADDYLAKPFAFSELLARIDAVMRRGTPQPIEDQLLLRLADLEVDLSARRVHRAGERIELTAQGFTLLTLLMRRRGEAMSRTTLAEQVWDMNFDSNTNVVDVAIRRLRAKVDEPYGAKLIHTVRGMGYVMEWRGPGEAPPP